MNDFFPRYIKILTSKKYKNEIDELRVEGHTSNTWKTSKFEKEIYLKNMQLSQKRANNVLSYCYQLNNNEVEKSKKWLEKTLRANGMAFAKLIYKKMEKLIYLNQEELNLELLLKLKKSFTK